MTWGLAAAGLRRASQRRAPSRNQPCRNRPGLDRRFGCTALMAAVVTSGGLCAAARAHGVSWWYSKQVNRCRH